MIRHHKCELPVGQDARFRFAGGPRGIEKPQGVIGQHCRFDRGCAEVLRNQILVTELARAWGADRDDMADAVRRGNDGIHMTGKNIFDHHHD